VVADADDMSLDRSAVYVPAITITINDNDY